MYGPDQLTAAAITAAARRLASWHELTSAQTAAAARELQDVANGRSDLLAEVAGLPLGAHQGSLDEPEARAAAELCRAAGADEDLIPRWLGEGRRRAANARQRPLSSNPAAGNPDIS